MKPYISGQAALSPRLILSSVFLKSAQQREDLRFFSYARYALAEIVHRENLSDSGLYAPSYICREAVAGLTVTERSVEYYPVCANLEPDWEWLSRNVRSGGALLLVHYFGFPNALDKALMFCQDHKLLLIEDCAHSFLTRRGGQLIGTFGNYGIYSYRKLLPLLDGAGLVSRQQGLGQLDSKMSSTFRRSPIQAIIRQMLKLVVLKLGLPISSMLQPSRAGDEANDADSAQIQKLDPRMTGLSYRLLQLLEAEYDTIISLRRKNYAALLDAFSKYPEVSLPYAELAEGVCPQVFPMLVGDAYEVVTGLSTDGIPAQTWPFLPSRVRNNSTYLTANWLRGHLVVLPVHQGLDSRHIDQMVDAYHGFRQQAGGKSSGTAG